MDYEFDINNLSPLTLPAVRLARYLDCISKILGSPNNIHLLQVRDGSAVPCFHIDDHAQEAVDERIAQINSLNMPKDLSDACDRLDALLREDKSTAILRKGAQILHLFPGVEGEVEEGRLLPSAPVTIKGTLLKIGGRDQTIPFEIERGATIYKGNVSKPLAIEMAQYLFRNMEVKGEGQWLAKGLSRLRLRNFVVEDFKPLDESTSLIDLCRSERERDTNDHDRTVDDLLNKLNEIRYGERQ